MDAHDGGGTYRLLNNAFFIPLGLDDLVRAELNGDGLLQVVDVVEPSARLLTMVAFDAGMSADQVHKVADGWAHSGGAWTEGRGPYCVSSWDESETIDSVLEHLAAALAGGTVFELLAVSPPDQRDRASQSEIDFALDTAEHLAPSATAYWAAGRSLLARARARFPRLLGARAAAGGRGSSGGSGPRVRWAGPR